MIKIIPFKLFVAKNKKEVRLPALETTGLSSNQEPKKEKRLPALWTTGLKSNQIKEESDIAKIKNLHNELVKHYKHSSKYITSLSRMTIRSYYLNKQLHAGYNKGNDPEKHYISKLGPRIDTKTLDNALHEHRTPKELHVYSGLYHTPKSGSYHHPAYLHTSLDYKTAQNFADNHYDKTEGEFHQHVLKIHVPKGHPGSYVSHISHHHPEKEFILPRNTKLHIHPNPERITRYRKNGIFHNVHIHHATIIK